MLQLKNINVQFGINHVLKNLSCTVEQGDFIIVVGSNGAGKSSFFDTIAGTIVPKAAILFAPSIITLLRYAGFPARHRRRFALRHQHFDLTKHHHNLLCAKPLLRHHQSSFPRHSLTMLGLKKPGQVSPGVRNPEKPSDERHFSTPAAIASQQRHGEAHDTSRNRLPQIPFHFCLVT